jgi:FlaA1/EpsC-like NDP-sugar epimerase
MKAKLFRRWLSEVIQMALAAVALAGAFLLRFEFKVEPQYATMFTHSLPLVLGVKFFVFRAFGLRDLSWRHPGFQDLARIALANAAASGIATLIVRAVIGSRFPRSIHILDLLLSVTLTVAARVAARVIFETRVPGQSRILIYGAGEDGVTMLSGIRANPQWGYHVAGFLDDNPQKRNLRVNGTRVLGGLDNLESLARKHRIEQVLLALPRATGAEISTIVEQCHAARIAPRRLPTLTEFKNQRPLAEHIRDVPLEDLLGRPPVAADPALVRARIRGRVILVTGAGGSIGSELCRQIARHEPRALVGLDNAETALYQIDQELRELFPGLAFYPEIGNIQNRRRVEEVFRDHHPAAVYHAAAYKHVPMMEAHLFEAVENNVFGTRNVVRAAIAAGTEDFVLVSSDKAVRATSVMGATKRLAELICSAAGSRCRAVRFGNVLGSNGSVIPLFQRQIAAGGPVTVTHPEIRRFFMTIPEAAGLVLHAAAMERGGQIFALDMGEPVRIQDLARNLILLSGLKPDVDIRIVFSGLRPGEKLCEELCGVEEDTLPTTHPKIRIFTGKAASQEDLSRGLEDLRRAAETSDAAALMLALQQLVPDYYPSSFLLRKTEKARVVVA